MTCAIMRGSQHGHLQGHHEVAKLLQQTAIPDAVGVDTSVSDGEEESPLSTSISVLKKVNNIIQEYQEFIKMSFR